MITGIPLAIQEVQEYNQIFHSFISFDDIFSLNKRLCGKLVSLVAIVHDSSLRVTPISFLFLRFRFIQIQLQI